VKHPKPYNVSPEGWTAIKKAVELITEHYDNIGLFINWVDDDGETQHCEVLHGNGFALENHIDKWVDGEFLPDEFDDNDEDDKPKKIKL